MLGHKESVALPIIKGIVERLEVPGHMTDDYVRLVSYVVLQMGRTQSSSNSVSRRLTATFLARAESPRLRSEFLSHGGTAALWERLKVGTGQGELSLRLGAASVTRTMGATFPVYLDLSLAVYKNESPLPFVTSDSPVCVVNSWCAGSDSPSSCTGVSRGIQIVFPISPHVALVLFDPQVYETGTNRSGVIPIRRVDRVERINALQCGFAERFLYFKSSPRVQSWLQRVPRTVGRRAARIVIRERDIGGPEGDLPLAVETPFELKDPLPGMTISKHAARVPIADRPFAFRIDAMNVLKELDRLGCFTLPPPVVSPENPGSA